MRYSGVGVTKQQSLIDVVHEGEEESRTLPGV